jgi:hypothetical protein
MRRGKEFKRQEMSFRSRKKMDEKNGIKEEQEKQSIDFS